MDKYNTNNVFLTKISMDDVKINDDAGDVGYQFDDDITSSSEPVTTQSSGSQNGNGNGGYATELFSKTVHAKFRTFYIDVKESRNGRFVKISEKSRGKKSTVMMDAEDVPAVIDALKEAQGKL
jgi:hypothetical protein